MIPKIRFATVLLALFALFTAIIMLIQIGFKAIGWTRLRSSWYAPYMEEILLGAIIIFIISAFALWRWSGTADK